MTRVAITADPAVFINITVFIGYHCSALATLGQGGWVHTALTLTDITV